MKNNITLAVAGLIVGALGTYLFTASKTTDFVMSIDDVIAVQDERLRVLADSADKNEETDVVIRVLDKCGNEEQERFDQLLNTLSSLQATELGEAKSLLEICGRYSAEKKLLLVATLEKEFEVYQSYVALREGFVDGTTDRQYNIEKWQTLIDLEAERAESLANFANLQSEIIDALIAGNTLNSDSITKLNSQVQAERESYTVLNTRIAAAREAL